MAIVAIPILENTVKASNSRVKDPIVNIQVADAILDANITTLFNAINGITLGTLVKSTLITREDKDVGSSDRPASTLAQKETRFKAFYTDVLGNKGTQEFPTADLALLVTGTQLLDIETPASAGETLKNALEAHMLSAQGNAITVDRVELFTRN